MIEPTTAAEASPAQAPERAEFLRRQTTATVAWLLDWALRDLAAALSTDSSTSIRDRLQTEAVGLALRPWLPKLRDIALARLATTDPVVLEELLGATASAAEAILGHAPGDPLPRRVLGATDDGRPALVARGS